MKIHIVPCLIDNYAYVLEENHEAILIDAPEFSKIDDFLNCNKLRLTTILCTHHHWDHTQAILELKEIYDCHVYGFKGDQNRIPGITHKLEPDEIFEINGTKIKCIFIPGHTLGQVGYYFTEDNLFFPGDTLFSMGCGRLFEGTPEQMFESLSKIRTLPGNTQVYCGHEYSIKNAEFCLKYAPSKILEDHYQAIKKLRTSDLPTVPTTLELELKINPFLSAKTVSEFIRLRELRNQW